MVRRNSTLNIVDLPAPVRPTTPTDEPRGMVVDGHSEPASATARPGPARGLRVAAAPKFLFFNKLTLGSLESFVGGHFIIFANFYQFYTRFKNAILKQKEETVTRQLEKQFEMFKNKEDTVTRTLKIQT